ncbi:unnamed protein product [Rhizoctonia solani]|uniref:Uncharacterized protein n=1 Tax=Rhizoctonia solani TaxID=456999 RepID=A0A8H3BCM6_9AGAM|nr:unnamed protein product [Rhizoctonia solani]
MLPRISNNKLPYDQWQPSEHELVKTLSTKSNPGILVHQTGTIILSEPTEEQLWEIVNVYLTEITWEEINPKYRLTNHTMAEMKYELGRMNDTSTTNSYFSANIRNVVFNFGDEWEDFSVGQDENEVPGKITVTILPGQTLYRYRRVFKFTLRTWWVMDDPHNKASCYIAGSSNKNKPAPYYYYLKGQVAQGERMTVTPLTGGSALDMKPERKRWNKLDMKVLRQEDLPESMSERIRERLIQVQEQEVGVGVQVSIAGDEQKSELVVMDEAEPIDAGVMGNSGVDGQSMQASDLTLKPFPRAKIRRNIRAALEFSKKSQGPLMPKPAQGPLFPNK